ncbi:MAG: XTP/dITP diphosphatase [Candidatus Omnitrophica bacterium]|nr:XTP/dITP diphosphatase [Candidatus Omnitrophota bacterium]
MKELLIATQNRHKVQEIMDLLQGLEIRISSLADYPDVPEIMEDGKTFEENAYKKAFEAAKWRGCWALADDSGLEVDALGGEPGVHSARYSGAGATDGSNNQKLLRDLEGVPEESRTARYVCCLALVSPEGGKEDVRQTCEGRIALAPRGDGGFGYDPLFYYPEFGRTFGEVSLEDKQKVSHRGKAIRRMAEIISQAVLAAE